MMDGSGNAAADVKAPPMTQNFTCARCHLSFPPNEKTEHDDWHFAQDLQAQDEAANASTTSHSAAAPSDKRSHSPPVDSKIKTASPATYAPPAFPPPAGSTSRTPFTWKHSNPVIEAGKLRATDEQKMQNALQRLQLQYNIWNSDIEPEHDTEYACGCAIHQYKAMKQQRYYAQNVWSKAVAYPGEVIYDDNPFRQGLTSKNPYTYGVTSVFYNFNGWGPVRSVYPARPIPELYTRSIHQTINLNNRLNEEAQRDIDRKEPKLDIWNERSLEQAMDGLSVSSPTLSEKSQSCNEKAGPRDEKRPLDAEPASPVTAESSKRKSTGFSGFKKALGIRSSQEKATAAAEQLRVAILREEAGRWPNKEWRDIVTSYQHKVGMHGMIANLRSQRPTQYLHLLRAGYFEPIPVAWATQNSNPLKFSIEAAAGWRGITPAWRGYEDTAEERLYWVLNHREGSAGARMKPDFISEMEMARARMATAVEPPPEYFSASDICHVQHTSKGYSKQVMPPPFQAFDRPETANDDTMILLDVSGSMDFDPIRPVYTEYLITSYTASTQPKNKHVAKAIIRRFTDAMSNHDHTFTGYDLVTFANEARYIGTINHSNLESMWNRVRIGGGTRVMTGWQKVKELHFQKHSESATHHPVYGWQAGPETPMLRLLLLLDGEATDMDEFELDLLGLSWAHVTIFLIGVDGCPHHHRHANELQRISSVNHHVSFVDAQGNTPERFVTHELLKRHLGYELSIGEFQAIEELPAYSET